MTSYKEYYNLCKNNYQKNEKCSSSKSIYNFTIDYSHNLEISKDKLLKLKKKVIDQLQKGDCERNEMFIGLKNNLYNLKEEIEEIAKYIIPYLEKNIYGCYLNLTRCYIYKNIKTNRESKSSWLWHWDNHPDESIKIIIYLTDTFENDGPFEYLKNLETCEGYKMETNRFGPTKWGSKDHPIYKGCRISNQQIKNISENKYKPFKITGKMGKIIIFKQNIIHKANIPTNNERIILTLQVKPIIEKRLNYFNKKFTGTFGNELCGAQGPSNPLITDNEI